MSNDVNDDDIKVFHLDLPARMKRRIHLVDGMVVQDAAADAAFG